MRKAVFLDRDGTINKEIGYLYKKEDLVFIDGSIDAVKIFHSMGFLVIVLTNQAGVARGYYNESDVKLLHSHFDNVLQKANTYIDAYYYCPHHPEGTVKEYSVVCSCRKPKTGMILKAIQEHNIDIDKSMLVGDKEDDIIAGIVAGLPKNILVRSGHKINELSSKADSVYNCLYDLAIDLATT